WPLFLVIGTVLFNEYFIYFIKIGFTCNWLLHFSDSDRIHVFFIADTHILGVKNGHWFDKLRREWQMYRSYHSAVHLLSPDAVFFLGDLMDEGQWGDWSTFAKYADRFDSLFRSSSSKPEVHMLAGNHDLGFHYAISPFRVQWFEERFNRSIVDTVTIKGHHFVLITSMALYGDGCRLCYEAEMKLENLAKELDCAKYGNCYPNASSRFQPFRRPILLQHFPLFRLNDDDCLRDDDFDDEDPARNELYRPGWEALSKASTQFLIQKFEPRAVFNGHTHRGCKKRWIQPVEFWEYTVNSFSWRNGDRPTFLLATISEQDVLVGMCDLPNESTVLYVYSSTGVIILLWLSYSI
ncbi:hypothetical protein Angca_007412, partial [Angiostrongylus cantonensis]